MHICFFYGGVHPTDGGIGFLGNLSTHLRSRGHVCSAILGETPGPLLDGKVHLEIPFPGDWKLSLGSLKGPQVKKLRRVLNDLQPDLVHIIYPSAFYGPHGHIQVLPALGRDFPTVATFWGLNLGRSSTWRGRATGITLLWTADVLACHDLTLLSILKRLCFGLRDVHFLPVGSNIQPSDDVLTRSREELRLQYNLDPKLHYLAYFGGFDPGRGLTDLFQATRRLRQNNTLHPRLLMIGWQRHLQHPAFQQVRLAMAQAGVEDLVVMTPFAPEAEVAALLRAADLCVLPFRQNPVGRSSLMAALCVGVPVVLASAVDLGVLRGAVRRVLPGRPDMLAENLEFLLTNPEQAKILSEQGHRTWESHFSWPQIAARHETVYRNLLTWIKR